MSTAPEDLPDAQQTRAMGLNLHAYQREAVERILSSAPARMTDGDMPMPAGYGTSRLHRPGQSAPQPPQVLVIGGPRDISYDFAAKLRAKFNFVIIDEAPFLPPDGMQIASRQLGKPMRFSEVVAELLLDFPNKVCEEPDPEPLPAIRAQRIKPMKGSAAAQWKRERNGRRQK
jgi:hypothetical protein